MVLNEDSRTIGLYGEVNERHAADIVGTMFYLRDSGKKMVALLNEQPPSKPEEGEKLEESSKENEPTLEPITPSPITFIISTPGGDAADMFSIYDTMRDVQKDCEVVTYGLGKVMSAGVLLLAAGTKGKRKVGKNCRLMIHAVSGGNYGKFNDMQNSMKETMILQRMYIRELAACSKLTEKKIKRLYHKNIDIYFDAEKAIEWGIADEIV